MIFHRNRLVAALNKYWRPLPVEEYLHRMDVEAVENAVSVAGWPKEVTEWIWVPVKPPGLNWKS